MVAGMNRIQKRMRIQPGVLATVFIILFLLLAVSGYVEFLGRRRSVITLMSQNAGNLSAIIQKSAVNSILSNDLLEDEIVERLLTTLHLIDHLDEEGFVTNAYLKEFAEDDKLYRIHIFDSQGKKVYSSTENHLQVPSPPEIDSVLSGERDKMVLGVRTASGEPGQRFGVAIHRSKGGAILANIDARQILDFRKEIGIGSLINSIAEDAVVNYIAIQDSLGILAASENVDSLSSFQSDPFLGEVSQSQGFRWRILERGELKLFESVRPFAIAGTSYGLIRIGMNYEPIRAIEIVAMRQTAIRLVILLLVGFVLFAFSIAAQNVNLLEKEKQKITEDVYRLQADLRQKERLSAMGELAAGVAHEIRNPLNAISMTVQRLGREFPPAENAGEQLQLIRIVRKEIDRIGNIIRQFLQFARPQSLHLQDGQLDETLNRVLELYRSKLGSHDIRLEWNPVKSIRARYDEEKISQVFVNLIENAVQAMPGGGELHCRMDRQHNKIRVIFRDTGTGIEEQNLDKIFNLYFTTKADGTGLGLAQVYQIVAEHGGSIEVASRIGEGTTFTIDLKSK